MQESSLEQKLKREIKSMGGMALKLVSPGMAGVPDRLVLFPGGRQWFVEMKAPGERLRPLQEKRKSQLESFGFQVRVVDSLKSLQEFLAEVQGGV